MGFDHGWRPVTCIENHDLVMAGRNPRIPSLADAPDPHSWDARTRCAVGTAILLTAPGIPQLFMGQEFLEEKPWDTDPGLGRTRIGWAGLQGGADPPWPIISASRRTWSVYARLRQRSAATTSTPSTSRIPTACSPTTAWIEGVAADVVVVAHLRPGHVAGLRTGPSFPPGFPG